MLRNDLRDEISDLMTRSHSPDSVPASERPLAAWMQSHQGGLNPTIGLPPGHPFLELDSARGSHGPRDGFGDNRPFDWLHNHQSGFNSTIGLPPTRPMLHTDGSADAHFSGEASSARPSPVSVGLTNGHLAQQGQLFANSPNQAAELSFLNGIDATGHIVAKSFQTWNFDDPATYAASSTASKWGAATAGTAGGTVNFYFKGSSHFTATEQTAIKSALALWSAVANIQFNEVTTSGAAQLTFKRGSDGSAYETDSLSGTAGAGTVGGTNLWTKTSATISIDTSVPGFGPIDGSFTAFGGYVWGTVIHEIGHALGLGHGGAYNGDVDPMTQQFSKYDSLAWTIMSYIEPGDSAKYSSSYPINTNWGISADGYTNTPTTVMMLDIIAAQQLYGAPTSTPLSGGQIYGFNCNIAGPLHNFFDFTVNSNPIVTLWNAGTGNTLDLSGFSTNATIDLNAGAFSSCDGMTNNLCIAMNTSINGYVGTSGADTVTANSGDDTLAGGGGNDVFIFAKTFTAADSVDGGAGSDTIQLNGKETVTFGAATVTNVETIALAAGGKYKLTTNDANVAAGKTMTIDGSTLGAADTLTFKGSAEKDGKFVIKGGAADDVLTGGRGDDDINGGAGNDKITGGNGADTITVSSGNDTLIYTSRVQSTHSAFDTIKGFEFNNGDHFDLDVAVTGTDGTVAAGALFTASFDANLATAVGSAQLAAHHAVLFTPTTGDYMGATFLVVDANGTAGYQSGADYVFRLDSPLHTANLDSSDFI